MFRAPPQMLSPPCSFEPPLPDKKLDAIRRLGFGVLNKVVMLFPTVFWDESLDTFGHVDASGGCTTTAQGSHTRPRFVHSQ